MNIGSIVTLIVIISTVAYILFVIYNAYLVKKQITISIIDLMYSCMLGSFSEILIYSYGKKMFICISVAYVVWLTILMYRVEQNKINRKSAV